MTNIDIIWENAWQEMERKDLGFIVSALSEWVNSDPSPLCTDSQLRRSSDRADTAHSSHVTHRVSLNPTQGGYVQTTNKDKELLMNRGRGSLHLERIEPNVSSLFALTTTRVIWGHAGVWPWSTASISGHCCVQEGHAMWPGARLRSPMLTGLIPEW